MPSVRHRLLLGLLLLPGLAGAADGLADLVAVRDGLQAELDARLAADADFAPPQEFQLTIDRGFGRKRRPLVLTLQASGGTFARAMVHSEREKLDVRGVDTSGLQLNGERLSGPVVIDYRVETDDGPVLRQQTYRLDAQITAIPERLVLTLKRFIGSDDWTLTYTPDGERWVAGPDLQTPRKLVDWGPFTRDQPALVAGDGGLTGTINLTKQKKGDEDRLFDAYEAGQHPEITFAVPIVDGRVGSTWAMRATGGKHMLGTGTDLLLGAVQRQEVTGGYVTEGDRGTWSGTLRGPVLPAPTSTAPVRLGEPTATDTPAAQAQRAAHLYRQIQALDLARRQYPMPVQAALDRVQAPPPVDATADEAERYIARLAQQAAHVAAEPVQPNHTGHQTVDDPAFGPYAPTGVLDGNAMPVVGEGPQQWAIVGDWQHAGPLPLFDQSTPIRLPEILPLAGLAYARSRPFTVDHQTGDVVVDQTPADWQPALQDGATIAPPVHRSAASGDVRMLANYFHTTLHSASDQQVWMALTGSGAIVLWVNGELLLDTGDLTAPRPSILPLPLRAGANEVLVRCASSESSNRYHDLISYTEGYDHRLLARSEFTFFQLHVATAGAPGAGFGPSQAAAPPASASRAGYRYDGAQVHAEATPPLAWGLEDGTNVAWRTQLPKGCGDPVHHDGRLYVVAEPDQLVCLDAADGSELWRARADVLPALGWTGAATALVDWTQARQQAARLVWEAGKDKAARAAAKKQGDELLAAHQALEKFLKDHGIRDRKGFANIAPVVTDEAVYVTFGTGVAACFGLDGSQRWLTATEAPWSETNMGSPVLVDGLFIVQGHLTGDDGQYALIAFDAATGERRWATRGPTQRVLNRFDRATGLGNGIALVALQRDGAPRHLLVTGDGAVIDAADGSLLHRDIFGIGACRAAPTVVGDRVFTYSMTGETLVRLWLDEADRIAVQTLWLNRHGHGRGRIKANHHWGDEHWMQSGVVDPQDGRVYLSLVDNAHVPQHYPLPWLGVDAFDLADGQRQLRLRAVAREASDPTVPPVIAGRYLIATDGGDPVPGFQGTTEYGQVSFVELGEHPFTVATSKITDMRAAPLPVGDRLFLRLYDSVVCIADTTAAGSTYLEEVLAQKLFDQIPERRLPEPMLTVPPVAVEAADGVPMNQLKPGVLPAHWLVLGPLPAKHEGDPLAAIGGEAGARPAAGTEVGEAAFRPVASEFIGRDGYGTPKHLDALTAIGKKTPSLSYFYTVLEVSEAMVLKFSNPGKGYTAWLAGEPIVDDSIVSLQMGSYPLLVKVPLGRLPPFMKKGLAIAPRFQRAKDPTKEFAAWAELVRRNKQRFERIMERLPGSSWAGKAELVLGQLKQFDEQQP